MKTFFVLTAAFLISCTSYARELKSNNLPIVVPEPRDHTINPLLLRSINEAWLNQEVFPEIEQIRFYSHNKKEWLPIPHSEITNNCFARRMLVDLFLWGEQDLKAQIDYQQEKIRYITPFLRNEDFIHSSWIETGRIQVVGMLQAGTTLWTNHEAVVVNTNNGIRVIDPSFANMALPLNDWFLYFAPVDFNKTCSPVDVVGLRKINTEIIRHLQFQRPWNPAIPKCGFIFQQRLDTTDLETSTGNTWGTPLEKFLSATLYDYMEFRLASD